GFVDEVKLLDKKEQAALNKEIRPVKLALVKVPKLAYKTIHSTTIILPAWHAILKDLSEPQTLMPRDVATWWNSTFDMLDYALEHREAVDTVMQWQDLSLQKYELEDNEWEILQQLRDILKLTDRSHTYQISMVLHPQHKLLYFKAADWEDNWIQTAEQLVREEFECSYLSL
ncbi:hypothetical protein EV424DRAFT_1265938, partial [Suillus variegatus]